MFPEFERMYDMANVEKKHFVDPAWPEHNPADGHVVTELISKVAGASSPWGDDKEFPVSAEETGYVHPYTRINR
ncbi:Hypothetical protein [Corynebacterium glutamicum ATCC 13032]|uniref:Uncharacterized protein n=1 Tax=Corynebacterium glutamicum (strain ATCC 13032 / DSM 20300 / JCM 1318 / BCRC 11384 / CCUG 27702 / LMG 3730 / NBRC 12168 / NCIMB 10025 / NRRL B-2784 / 534) TaxID=196627 RepID=Q8NS61_CORGL|nr:Chain V, Actinobacterial supercomplex, subunit C (AscC) [Corynebacterium glutamicum ATCC 13032]7Q21_v Chain v, Actinobacterial supercomplex, subunit C (AscC) [Corynebacterium glutamicum ATCC 13032]7QHM_K Chain K, Actinobacterial supercomplex, subunit C (AscC) [Corynebacterium glutamicum ATCC 13032]7QHM_X Chain X, Actinobacterial supercomplex, subunit C (AscC) [Corynebacterium glutamicum ATCC 13032]7QHO_K Chain K, Actinobacterial supercomplex, subunit C (AscC) [Corynebacterium glutamicum ATCC